MMISDTMMCQIITIMQGGGKPPANCVIFVISRKFDMKIGVRVSGNTPNCFGKQLEIISRKRKSWAMAA